jgi:cytosine/adenosine deaminase-related metal-dependent hydrolase
VQTFAGRILTRRDVVEGWLQVDAGRVVDWGRGEAPTRPTASGWIVPAPVNAHTHIGDTWLRDRPSKPRDVAGLVGPGGWKQQHLARPDPAAMDAGAQRLAQEMAAAGTARFLDLREGGVAGAAWLRGLALDVQPVVLGRPAQGGADEEEIAAVLEVADGIGLSGMRDMKARHVEAWAEAAHAAGKPLAMHVSEDRRDDLDAVLALQPAFVVHMVHGSRADFEELAAARVPVVACPRSNAWFGLQSPVAAMLEAGVTVALGTDNGMLQDGDVLAEARALAAMWQSHRTGGPLDADEALLRMLTYHGRDLVGLADPLPPRRGEPVDCIVLPEQPFSPQRTKPGLDVAGV